MRLIVADWVSGKNVEARRRYDHLAARSCHPAFAPAASQVPASSVGPGSPATSTVLGQRGLQVKRQLGAGVQTEDPFLAQSTTGSSLVVMYGRDEEDWDQLADAGLEFLVERARLAKLTSYTELNATHVRRTGFRASTSGAPTSGRRWVTCCTSSLSGIAQPPI